MASAAASELAALGAEDGETRPPDVLDGHSRQQLAVEEVFGTPACRNVVRADFSTSRACTTLDIPAAEEIGNMFQYYGDFDQEFTGARDLNTLRELNLELRSFDDWLADNVSKCKAS